MPIIQSSIYFVEDCLVNMEEVSLYDLPAVISLVNLFLQISHFKFLF